MKFAKILLIVCVFGIISASAIERATSSAHAEYLSETKSLRITNGYKSLLANQGEIETINLRNAFPVTLEVGNKKQQATLQMQMLDNFRSGIPFILTAPLENEVTKHLIQKDTIHYLPFSTISNGSCFFQIDFESETKTINCNLNTQNNSVFKINLLKIDGDILTKNQVATTINQEFTKRASERKAEITKYYQDVAASGYQAMKWLIEIDNINKTKEKIKAEKTEALNNLKIQLKELQQKLSDLNKLFAAKSESTEKVKTTITTQIEERRRLTEQVKYYEISIENLTKQKSKINETINYQNKKDENKKLIKYWLKGAVYHRVINAKEKEGLETLVDTEKFEDFLKSVNDYFNPQ